MIPQWFTANVGLGTIYPAGVLLLFVLFFRYYFIISKPLTGTVEWIYRTISDKRWKLLRDRYPMVKTDILPIFVITAVFATLAFGNYFGAGASDYAGYVIARGGALYEPANPPLSYLINNFSNYLFGATPLGGGFITAVFGIFLLIVMYIVIKNMFGKTTVAVCGTLLLGFDFMRFVESGPHRSSTVFSTSEFVISATLILLSFLFMYRFMTTDKDAGFGKNVLPLALSGIFFGLAFSVVWAAFYFGFGLLAMFVVRIVGMRVYCSEKYPAGGGFGAYFVKTLLVASLFFIIIPIAIYISSYILHGLMYGASMSFSDIISAHRNVISPPRALIVETDSSQGVMFCVLSQHNLLQTMLNSGSIIVHESFTEISRSMVMRLGNPIVVFGGLLAMLAMIFRVIRRRDTRALIILFGYFGAILPWIISFGRQHILFFPGQPFSLYLFSVLFLVLGFAHVFNTVISRGMRRSKHAVYIFTAAAGVVFLMFYPALTGIYMPQWFFRDFLSWFPGRWPFNHVMIYQ